MVEYPVVVGGWQGYLLAVSFFTLETGSDFCRVNMIDFLVF